MLDFFLGAWNVLEPGRELDTNWHIELCCEELELVHLGQTNRLLINVAPRSAKSRLVSVAFPCWEWLDIPWLRYMCLSYATPLAIDHSQDRQTLIQSDWYQELSNGLELSRKKNRMTEFENSKRGVMLARGLDGSVTGAGGDRLIFDDPNDPNKVESDVIRTSTLRKFKDYSVTRRDNPKGTAIIVVQQRTHERDVSGYILSDLKNYKHVCLPTIAEKSEVIKFPISGRVVKRSPGDLLHPSRLGQDEVDEARITLGGYLFAGRHQQQPAPAEGGMFKIGKWRLYSKVPTFDRIIISVDCTFKKTNDSDFVVIEVIGEKCGVREVIDPSKNKPVKLSNYYLIYQWRSRAGITETMDAIRQTIARFPTAKTKLIEDKANGSAVIEQLSKNITGIVPFNPGSDSKESRAWSIQPTHERGGILLPIADHAKAELDRLQIDDIAIEEYWEHFPPAHRSNAEHVPVDPQWRSLIDEFAMFPNGANDDQVDCTDQAIIWMMRNSKPTRTL